MKVLMIFAAFVTSAVLVLPTVTQAQAASFSGRALASTDCAAALRA
jgi:hypothetical protein